MAFKECGRSENESLLGSIFDEGGSASRDIK
jgi:hypothetical protein